MSRVRGSGAPLDVPSSETSLNERIAATVRVVEHLEDVGVTHTKVLKDPLDDEVGYADVGSYWANFIRGAEVLKQLPEIGTLERAREYIDTTNRPNRERSPVGQHSETDHEQPQYNTEDDTI